jgi:hypothetical protein
MSSSGTALQNPRETSRAASLSLAFGVAAVVFVVLGYVLGVQHDDIMVKYCLKFDSAFDDLVPGAFFFAAFLLSLVAMVGGIVAGRRIRRARETLKGASRAKAGTWMGALDLLVIIVTLAFSTKIPSPFGNPVAVAGQSDAVGTLRTVNTSEVTYSVTYSTGFSETLEQLGGTSAPSTSEHAGLVGEKIAAGAAGRVYQVTYHSHRNPETGKIESYELNADPVCPGRNHYFTDQSGVIRSTKENRRATAQDPPLAG